MMWMWLSIRPGIRHLPPASMIGASGAAAARTSPSGPTARNLPSRIATASATGFARSSVVTFALVMMRSVMITSRYFFPHRCFRRGLGAEDAGSAVGFHIGQHRLASDDPLRDGDDLLADQHA